LRLWVNCPAACLQGCRSRGRSGL